MADELETPAPAADAVVEPAPPPTADAGGAEPAAPPVEAGAEAAPAPPTPKLSRRDTIKASIEKAKADAKVGEGDDRTAIEKQRDASGRFKTPDGKEPKPAAQEPQKNGAQPKAPQAPVAPPKAPEAPKPAPKSALKAPQSWSEAQKKDWEPLSESVKRTITNREAQVARGIQDFTQKWKPIQEFGTAFAQTVGPFEALMRQEAATRGEQYSPLKTIGGLMQTAAALRSHDMRTRASVAASILNTYGLATADGLKLLADALEGKAGPAVAASAPPNQPPQAVIDPQAIIRQAKDEWKREQQEEQSQQLYYEESANMAEFASTHEHFESVRERMADLMEMNARRIAQLPPNERVALDPEVAYRMACLSDPEIAPAYQQAEVAAAQAAEAEKAKANTPPAQRVPGPPSSIRSRPGGVTKPPTNGPLSRRETIAANYRKLHGQEQ